MRTGKYYGVTQCEWCTGDGDKQCWDVNGQGMYLCKTCCMEYWDFDEGDMDKEKEEENEDETGN
jgi:hypothetical protein